MMQTAKQIKEADQTKQAWNDGRTKEERAARLEGIKALNHKMEAKVREGSLILPIDDDNLDSILDFISNLKVERLETIRNMQEQGIDLASAYVERTRDQYESLSILLSKSRIEQGGFITTLGANEIYLTDFIIQLLQLVQGELNSRSAKYYDNKLSWQTARKFQAGQELKNLVICKLSLEDELAKRSDFIEI